MGFRENDVLFAVQEMIIDYVALGGKVSKLAMDLNVSQSTIYNIKKDSNGFKDNKYSVSVVMRLYNYLSGDKPQFKDCICHDVQLSL